MINISVKETILAKMTNCSDHLEDIKQMMDRDEFSKETMTQILNLREELRYINNLVKIASISELLNKGRIEEAGIELGRYF